MNNVKEVVIPTDFIPRQWQQDAFADMIGRRHAILVFHRRGGKTVFGINYIKHHAVNFNKCDPEGRKYKNPQFAFVATTRGQVEQIAWQYFKDYFGDIPGVKFNEAKLTVKFPHPHGVCTIFLFGAENFDAIRGLYLDGFILDEYADMHPDVRDKVLLPTLSDRKGWEIIIGTPKGENAFKELYDTALDNRDMWYSCLFRASETDLIPDDELAMLKKTMSDEAYRQEYECFPGDTSIATPFGQKKIKDICVGDIVYSHTGRARKVTALNKQNFFGELVAIDRAGWTEDLHCTPDHPILIRRGTKTDWTKASEVREGDYVLTPRKAQPSETSFLSLELIQLMAWYITEGSFSKTHVTLSLNYKNEVEILRVELLLTKLGLSFSGKEADTAYNIQINDTALCDFLISHCGKNSYDKKIPFTLVKGFEKEFIEELVLGDGCEVKGVNYKMYVTSSVGLARDLMLLSSFCGVKSRSYTNNRPLTTVIEGRTVNQRKNYGVYLYFNPVNRKENKVKMSRHYTEYRVEEVGKSWHNDKVYNFSVEVDESYIADGIGVHNCDFNAAPSGKYYQSYIDEIRRAGQVTNVPYENESYVTTYWDLGFSDSTAVWFVQEIGRELRIINYLQWEGKGLDSILPFVESLKYKYNVHKVPHDASHHELSTGRSRLDFMRDFTHTPIEIIPKTKSVAEDIHVVRQLLPKCWFDSKECFEGIKALSAYERKWDARKQVYSDTPLHNWASHAADAFRQFAVDYQPGFSRNYGFQNNSLPTQASCDYDILTEF